MTELLEKFSISILPNDYKFNIIEYTNIETNKTDIIHVKNCSRCIIELPKGEYKMRVGNYTPQKIQEEIIIPKIVVPESFEFYDLTSTIKK